MLHAPCAAPYGATRLVALFLGGLLLLALPACDSADDSDDPEEASSGGVTFDIAGDGVDESYEWNTYFATGTDPDTGAEAFAVYLFAGEAPSFAGRFGLMARASARPSTGTYAFGDVEEDEDEVFTERFSFAGGTSSSRFFYANGGTLTITSSSSNRVAGRFDVQATLQTGERERPVNITGSFDAPSGTFVNGSLF